MIKVYSKRKFAFARMSYEFFLKEHFRVYQISCWLWFSQILLFSISREFLHLMQFSKCSEQNVLNEIHNKKINKNEMQIER